MIITSSEYDTIREFVDKREYKKLNEFIFKSEKGPYFRLWGLAEILNERKNEKVPLMVGLERKMLYIKARAIIKFDNFKEEWF